MFKKLILAITSLFVAATVSAATVTWSTTNWNVNVPLSKATTLSQVADTPYSDGTFIVVGPPTRYPNTNNGSWTSDLYAGTYKLDVEGLSFAKSFYFLVPAGSGSYNAAALRITNSTTVVIANLYDSFISKTNGTGLSNTFTKPFLSGAITLLDTVPTFYVGATHAQSLTLHSGLSGNMHWSGSLVIDGVVHGGSGLVADSGSIIGGPIVCNSDSFYGDGSGLTNVNINNTVGTNVITWYSHSNGQALTSATLVYADGYGAWHGAFDGDATGLTNINLAITGTNATPPVSTSIIKAWVNVTLPDGNVLKMPLYK